MNEFRRLSKLHHLYWEVLASSVVDRDLAVRGAGDEESANVIVSEAT